MYWRLTSVIWNSACRSMLLIKRTASRSQLRWYHGSPSFLQDLGSFFILKWMKDINQSKYTCMSCHREMPVGERAAGHICGMGLMGNDIACSWRYKLWVKHKLNRGGTAEIRPPLVFWPVEAFLYQILKWRFLSWHNQWYKLQRTQFQFILIF